MVRKLVGVKQRLGRMEEEHIEPFSLPSSYFPDDYYQLLKEMMC